MMPLDSYVLTEQDKGELTICVDEVLDDVIGLVHADSSVGVNLQKAKQRCNSSEGGVPMAYPPTLIHSGTPMWCSW